jgi:hypothetical protein
MGRRFIIRPDRDSASEYVSEYIIRTQAVFTPSNIFILTTVKIASMRLVQQLIGHLSLAFRLAVVPKWFINI